MVETDTGLKTSYPALGVELEDVPHVFREVEDDSDVATLAGERSPAATAKHWSAVLATGGDGGDYVIVVSGNYNTERHLAVVGTVAGVERAAAVIESNFAMKALSQASFETSRVFYGPIRSDGRGRSQALKIALTTQQSA